MHLGSDEPIDLGQGRTPRTPQVFADHVDRVAGYLAGSGARPMIWDDAIQQDKSILGLIPRETVVVTFHYGAEKTYRPYIDPIANAGFDQMVSPGAANWNELYPDLATSYANVARFVGEAKDMRGTRGMLGMFMTVWHDDGETLYEATWPALAYAAATAWQLQPVDDASWHRTFARAFFGSDDPRYADALDRLQAIRANLKTTPSDPPDYLFWHDPFDPRLQARFRAEDEHALRDGAEAALTDVLDARPPLHPHAAAAMALGALRYDALGRRLQIGREARGYYDDGRAAATKPGVNQVYRSLNVAKYLCWELRDAVAEHRAALRGRLALREHGAGAGAHPAALPARRGRRAALRRPDRRGRARGLLAHRQGAGVGRGDVIGSLSGVAIVAVFLLLAGLMIARKLPALLAVPLMALATAALAGVGDLAGILTAGAVKLAPVYATLFFGALLSRVVLSTGIAETLVTYAAEFGGDQPLVLALLLSAVVAILFTTVTGLGAIIMIGTIVLPVLMTVGIPRATSATLFLLAFGLGYILNIAQWKFYSAIFGVDRTTFQGYALVLFAVQAVVLVGYALVRTRAAGDYAASVVPGEPPRKRAGPAALITPVLPLVLLIGLHVDAIVAFALAALYGVLVTRPRAVVQTLVAAWIRGIEDVAPATILMIGIGMLLVAAQTPQVQAAVTPLVAAVAPRSPLGYVLLFGLLSPLALYRGPLNPYGVGIGVYTVLATLHVLPPVALVAAVMAVVQVQNVCDPTNTQNVWVANFTGVSVERITRLTLPWQVGVATLAVIAVVVAGGALFGKAPFALPAAAASTAASVPQGLFAPPAAARTVAVLDDGSLDARAAAHEIAAEVGRGWSGYRVVAASADPAAADCRAKPYAAALRVSATSLGRDDRDVGVELVDCAGWSVDQWHAQGADVRRAALDVLFRVRVWSREHAALAGEVFERGLAFDPADPQPTYFYVLFKPADGYMRALVRPGGPAWTAGLRTGDVIDKLDGKFWWEYGTYQTQLRAYDGKPHAFDVERGRVGGPAEHVDLGAPFAG